MGIKIFFRKELLNIQHSSTRQHFFSVHGIHMMVFGVHIRKALYYSSQTYNVFGEKMKACYKTPYKTVYDYNEYMSWSFNRDDGIRYWIWGV